MAHSEGLKLTRVRFPFLFWKKGSQNRKLHKIIEEGSVESESLSSYSIETEICVKKEERW